MSQLIFAKKTAASTLSLSGETKSLHRCAVCEQSLPLVVVELDQQIGNIKLARLRLTLTLQEVGTLHNQLGEFLKEVQRANMH